MCRARVTVISFALYLVLTTRMLKIMKEARQTVEMTLVFLEQGNRHRKETLLKNR